MQIRVFTKAVTVQFKHETKQMKRCVCVCVCVCVISNNHNNKYISFGELS